MCESSRERGGKVNLRSSVRRRTQKHLNNFLTYRKLSYKLSCWRMTKVGRFFFFISYRISYTFLWKVFTRQPYENRYFRQICRIIDCQPSFWKFQNRCPIPNILHIELIAYKSCPIGRVIVSTLFSSHCIVHSNWGSLCRVRTPENSQIVHFFIHAPTDCVFLRGRYGKFV